MWFNNAWPVLALPHMGIVFLRQEVMVWFWACQGIAGIPYRLKLHWLPGQRITFIVRNCVVETLCSCQRSRSSTYGDLCVPRVVTDRYGRRAFAVSSPQLWNQLPAAKRATTPDCFKRASKESLFPWVGVMLQITATLSNFLKGVRSKVYNISINNDHDTLTVTM